MPEKQREQQHLNVRAVHIGVGQDAHLAVAKVAQVGRVVWAVRVHAYGHRYIVNFSVGKQAVALDFPSVEHFTAQGQHSLVFFVTPHFGATPRGIALHQKHFVVGNVFAFAVSQLAWQHRHARAFSLFNFLTRFLARLRCFDGEFSKFFAIFHMLVQPQLQLGAHKTGNQTHSVTRIKTFFNLPLKLGVQHLGAEHIAGPCKHVFRHELDAFGQQGMQLNKALDRVEQAVSQPAVVGAARAGGYEVDIAFTYRCAVFCKGHRPRSAFALGKLLALAIGKTVALKKRHHRVARQGLHQIVAQPALVLPSLGVLGFLVGETDCHARHQHRFAAQ